MLLNVGPMLLGALAGGLAVRLRLLSP